MISEVLKSNQPSEEQGFDLATCFDQAAQNGYVKDADYYFDSYSHFTIHQDMLKDTVRTKSYMDAIMNSAAHIKDKIVLDIGSGTGILSIFAAKAGAKHVYAIEAAGIYQHSRKIIQQNGLEDRITVINGKVEEVELPVEQVDTIISEWMGYFLIYESMLDTVLFARDKWLKKDGMLFPDRAAMFIAGIEDQQYYYNTSSFWDSGYGFSMKTLKEKALKTPLIYMADPDFVVTDSYKFKDIDLLTVKVSDLDFLTKFTFRSIKPTIMHGVAAWFTVDFSHTTKTKQGKEGKDGKDGKEEPNKKKERSLVLSTSPFTKPTHWKNTLFYLHNPLSVGYKQEITGTINVKKAPLNHREIDVDLQIQTGGSKVSQQYRIN